MIRHLLKSFTVPITRAVFVLSSICVAASSVDPEILVLWGLDGRWEGALTTRGGPITEARLCSFEDRYGNKSP